jgi:two-component system, OmpR family, sensor histidine kinase CreC
MPLGVRIFLVYFLFVGLSGYFVLSTVMDEIRPGVRQSTEETLVDTANLLAEILRDDVKNGTLDRSKLRELLRAYGTRKPQATIWGIEKTEVNHRIYVTDRNGIVLLDSAGIAEGQNYSQWNDVYRTLHGQYGARTTREDADDENSSIMYVAAPITDSGDIIGAVSVTKPNASLQPYIERSQVRLTWLGGGLIALGLLIGALLSWWMSGALRELTRYASAVSEGQRVAVPNYAGGEFEQLATALERMRAELDGKAYVERYIQTLTHELKSPLAAIRAAIELLQQDLPAEQRARFTSNIDSESLRMQQMIERLLNLAMIEQRQQLEEHVDINLHSLADEVTHAQVAPIHSRRLAVTNSIAKDLVVRGERFLLRQALANLLENAIDFTPTGKEIRLSAQRSNTQVDLVVSNQGEQIPDYARPRLTERFYSLPRPATGRKSTGLGLNFVQEVAHLHGGSLQVNNTADGVEARLSLPVA